MMASIRTSIIAIIAPALGLLGCAPPDPAKCRCDVESEVPACKCDSMSLEIAARESPFFDTADWLDAVELPFDLDGATAPDELLEEADADAQEQGEVDAGPPCPGKPECSSLGVCAAGVPAHCSLEGVWVCDYAHVPGFEFGGEHSCDGKDNDCDGETDELLLPPPGICKTSGVCASLVPVCAEGQWNCGYDSVADYEGDQEKSCDGKDNDCDGTTDETEEVCKECKPPETRCTPDKSSVESCSADGNGWISSACPEGTECMGLGLCTKTAKWKVNKYEKGNQANPAVAVIENSGQVKAVVVAWQSMAQDGEDFGIYFRVYDELGAEIVPETRANLYTTGAQKNPAVAQLAPDRFFIGWESNFQDGTQESLYGRAFWLNGVGTAEMLLTESTAGPQKSLALASLPWGGAAMVWSDEGDGSKIKGSLFSPDGVPAGWEKGVTFPAGVPDVRPALASVAGDSLVVAWEHGLGNTDILARIVSAPGTGWTLLSETPVAATSNAESEPVAAFLGDSLFVGWKELAIPISACVKRYSPYLTDPSEKKCVPNSNNVLGFDLAPLLDGRVVLFWVETTGSTQVAKLASLSSDFAAWSDVKVLDSGTIDVEGGVSMAAMGGGKLLLLWSRESTGTGLDVWAQFVQAQ